MATTVLTVVALAMSGCARVGDRVTVLGDSITALGQNQMEHTLGDTYDLSVSGVFGARTDQRLQAAQLQAALNPTRAIINLGTNDVLQHRATNEIAANLVRLIGIYHEADCVYLVTINTHLDQDGNRPQRAATDLNAVMERIVAQNSQLRLIRWDQMIDRAAPRQLTFDGVHPTPEGQRLLADAYATALRRC